MINEESSQSDVKSSDDDSETYETASEISMNKKKAAEESDSDYETDVVVEERFFRNSQQQYEASQHLEEAIKLFNKGKDFMERLSMDRQTRIDLGTSTSRSDSEKKALREVLSARGRIARSEKNDPSKALLDMVATRFFAHFPRADKPNDLEVASSVRYLLA